MTLPRGLANSSEWDEPHLRFHCFGPSGSGAAFGWGRPP